MEQSPSWETKSLSLSWKFSTFYETHSFITVFTRTCHSSLSWVTWIQSTPSDPVSLRSILMLSLHLCQELPSDFLTKILYIFPSPMHATYPAHLIFLDSITIIFGEEYKLWSSLLCSFLQPTTIFSLLGVNILLRTLFLTPSIYVLPLICETKFHERKYR